MPTTTRTTRPWLVLAILCLSLLLAVVDNTIVNVALPTLSTELSASTTQLQWIVDAYTLVFAALLLPMGHFGDRFGRKKALIIGLGAFAATSALAAASTTAPQLIGSRALMGVGAALLFPATLAILVNVFTDPKQRAAAIGIWTACTGLAVAIGPITGGFLLEHFSWGSIFIVNIPVCALAILLGLIFVPDSMDAAVGRMDFPGLVLSIAGVGLLIWSIIEAPSWGWTSPAILAAMLTAIALLVVFVIMESRTAHPLLDITLFANMRFSAAAISVMAAFFALFGFIFLITQFFQLIQGYSPLEAGLRTLPFALATGIMSPVAIVLMHRFGSKLVVATGLFVMAIGFVMAATVKADSPYFGIVVLSMITMAVGLALTTSPATESIMGALPAERAGVGSAVNDTTREFGGTLGVAIIGSVFASIYSAQVADALSTLRIDPAASAAIESSVGAGASIASQLPAPIGVQVQTAIDDAFISGMSRGSIVAALVALIGSLIVLRYLPARSREMRSSGQEPSGTLTVSAVEA